VAWHRWHRQTSARRRPCVDSRLPIASLYVHTCISNSELLTLRDPCARGLPVTNCQLVEYVHIKLGAVDATYEIRAWRNATMGTINGRARQEYIWKMRQSETPCIDMPTYPTAYVVTHTQVPWRWLPVKHSKIGYILSYALDRLPSLLSHRVSIIRQNDRSLTK
jgi:hypothetical protein